MDSVKNGSWRGLFFKEWMISRAEVMTLLILNAVIGISLPFIVGSVFTIPQDISDGFDVFIGIWLLAHLFIGLKLLYTSVNSELKHPDIWLHSQRSVFQLIGVKAMFAVFITAAMLIVGGVMLGVSVTLSSHEQPLSLIDSVLVSLSVMTATFLISIYITAMGFFFWSIYQVLRSRIGSIAVIVTPLIFLVYTYVLDKIRMPLVFDKITSFGSVKFTNSVFYNEASQSLISVIVPDGVVFTIGAVLFYGFVAAMFFLVGSWLFEKKVRF